jgi:hypothetical protein
MKFRDPTVNYNSRPTDQQLRLGEAAVWGPAPMTDRVEILSFKPHRANTMRGYADVKVSGWHLTFYGCTVGLDDLNPAAHALLGKVLVHFGDYYDRALDELKRAIDLNGSDAEAYSGLLSVLLWPP